MPAELATPLSFERDAEEDPQVRIEAADALYLIALQVLFFPIFRMNFRFFSTSPNRSSLSIFYTVISGILSSNWVCLKIHLVDLIT
jgi:hypothetical protein